MEVYQIDYDLRNGREYLSLYERIKQYPAWCRPLASTWVIQTSQTVTQVLDNLLGAMDQDDGILVTRLSGEAAWKNIDPEVPDYLKNLLKGKAA
jgi:hypothetical protein